MEWGYPYSCSPKHPYLIERQEQLTTHEHSGARQVLLTPFDMVSTLDVNQSFSPISPFAAHSRQSDEIWPRHEGLVRFLALTAGALRLGRGGRETGTALDCSLPACIRPTPFQLLAFFLFLLFLIVTRLFPPDPAYRISGPRFFFTATRGDGASCIAYRYTASSFSPTPFSPDS